MNGSIDQRMLRIILITLAIASASADANLDYFRSQDLDIASHYWAMDNSSLSIGPALGCSYCGEFYYHEPPPDDIMFMPSPPLHPSIYANPAELAEASKKQLNDQCNFCNLFYSEEEQLDYQSGHNQSMNNRIIALLLAFLMISVVLFLYMLSTRRSKIIASLTRTRLFKSSNSAVNNQSHQLDKNNPLNEPLSNSGVHLTDPCFLQTNRDKNLTSPIISDHVPHKKTSIPSKYWAQPGSIIGRTVRRIPNEYEVPSSRTNSTGTSSAVYADMNNENNNQRFFSPYNLHTYAEVREVLDPNEHFHTSSNSSVMLSESNYDNAVYSHGGCVVSNGNIVTAVPNGSVQMSDFNSMRPVQSMAYSQQQPPPLPTSMNHQQMNQSKIHHNTSQPIYEQPPPQRAQIIITSNNQGVNPTLLNYKERIHNVI